MTLGTAPLCVDLDGTLCRSDTLWESVLQLLRQAPWLLLSMPFWLLRGRAAFKHRVAERAQLDAGRLPYHEELLAWLRQQRREGRELVLCTAAEARIAQAVSDHLGLFSSVIATTDAHNLKGERKRDALVQRYGTHGFDYAGNDRADLPVWSSARRAVVVSAPVSVRRSLGNGVEVERIFDGQPLPLLAWMRALRIHQWVKNFLIFLPLLLSHRLSYAGLADAAVAFLAFSLCASSVYLLNDLFDLDADRRHPRKRERPFASGLLSIPMGLAVAAALLTGAVGLATALPDRFMFVLGFYYAVTLTYSLYFKRFATIDVMLLAGLYTLRLIAGGAATATMLSFWLLAFSMFLFLSLAVVKRYAELLLTKDGDGKAAGRGYVADDLPLLRALGVASGFASVLVLALYVNSPQSIAGYSSPKVLWLLCPLLLYWISRVWMLTHRGRMHDDPVVFALRDRVSLVLVAAMAAVVMLAL
jgi:4-hydroxybenzoate polyprenyltransferase